MPMNPAVLTPCRSLLLRVAAASFAGTCFFAVPSVAQSTVPQAITQLPKPDATGQKQAPGTTTAGQSMGSKGSPNGNQPATGQNAGDTKSATNTPGAGEGSASTTKLKLGPLDPSVPPTNLPRNRPVIGLVMGGGGALGLSEIGTLQWLEDHHVPVDVIAGTSMGSILAALYSTGHTPEELKHLLTEKRVNRVFRVESDYANLSFRRREDERQLPNAIGVGLKHGVALRNSILLDTGLNELLDREFLNYNDQTDFNKLPIPFRCQATDLNEAKTVTFSRGSLQDAVRASASIPGVFRPFELNGHEFVDGAILENLPATDVKKMGADVIIAISLPLEPVGKGDLDSILGVLQRAFAVGIESNEARDRKLANVLIMPDIKGYSAGDYLKTEELAALGYKAAEDHKAALIQYALPDAQWQAYLAHRTALIRPPATTINYVKVKARDPDVKAAVDKMFKPLAGKPVNTDEIESLLADVRADGRYDADYTVGYDGPNSQQPIILVQVSDKKTGPPFLDLGANIAAQTSGVTRATLNAILLYQDLGGYGNGLRAHIDLGFETRFTADYFKKIGERGYFLMPNGGLIRQPYYIYSPSGYRLSERQYQQAGGGLDFGWGDHRKQEARVGWEYQQIGWNATTGSDSLPAYNNSSQRVHVKYIFDNQDRALVPSHGFRVDSSAGYLYNTPGSPTAPYFTTQFLGSHRINPKNVLLLKAEGGTYFNRDVAQPFRFTLGGPLRISSLAIDQLRGTDYFLFVPGYLRRIAQLPAPLGQSIYVGLNYGAGEMRAPDAYTVLRQDISLGVVAETPLGVISIFPSFGDGGYRKFTFTLGKLF